MQDFRFEAQEHAKQMCPIESCGLVVDGKYFGCTNIADDPCLDFVIDGRDYAVAALTGRIEAVVHSHPQGGPPSDMDIRSCKGTNMPWHIYSVPDETWSTITP